MKISFHGEKVEINIRKHFNLALEDESINQKISIDNQKYHLVTQIENTRIFIFAQPKKKVLELPNPLRWAYVYRIHQNWKYLSGI